MKPTPESRELIDDVLAESAPAEFRAAVLGETLRLARHRRWRRRAGRAAIVAAVACLVGTVVWRSAPRGVTAASLVARCEQVSTRPLAAEAVVSTRAFDPARVISTTATVVVVSTTPAADAFHLIGDQELLALAAPRTAALVRVGPEAQELIFIDLAGRDETR